jgi:hypothetical protein
MGCNMRKEDGNWKLTLAGIIINVISILVTLASLVVTLRSMVG